MTTMERTYDWIPVDATDQPIEISNAASTMPSGTMISQSSLTQVFFAIPEADRYIVEAWSPDLDDPSVLRRTFSVADIAAEQVDDVLDATYEDMQQKHQDILWWESSRAEMIAPRDADVIDDGIEVISLASGDWVAMYTLVGSDPDNLAPVIIEASSLEIEPGVRESMAAALEDVSRAIDARETQLPSADVR